MRVPVSSETDAFRSVLAVAGVVAVCLVLAYAFGLIAAAVLAALALLAVLAWMLLPSGCRLRRAAAAGGAQSRAGRILLIATEAPTDDQFKSEILDRFASQAALEVHAPVLQSRSHFVTTDIDHETQEARRRLQQTLRAARSARVAASGRVGDPIDPLAGVEDELRRYRADEVIVTTHPAGRANWVEAELLRRLRSELDRPVVQVTLDGETGSR
jgi:hypothetical protein